VWVLGNLLGIKPTESHVVTEGTLADLDGYRGRTTSRKVDVVRVAGLECDLQ